MLNRLNMPSVSAVSPESPSIVARVNPGHHVETSRNRSVHPVKYNGTKSIDEFSQFDVEGCLVGGPFIELLQ